MMVENIIVSILPNEPANPSYFTEARSSVLLILEICHQLTRPFLNRLNSSTINFEVQITPEPNGSNPFTIKKQMFHRFNFALTYRAYIRRGTPSSKQVFSGSQHIFTVSPPEMADFWKNFERPNQVPNGVRGAKRGRGSLNSLVLRF